MGAMSTWKPLSWISLGSMLLFDEMGKLFSINGKTK